MKSIIFILIILLISACGSNSEIILGKVAPPPIGIYHAAFPDFAGSEDTVTAQRIIDFETMVGKKIVWAYFSNNWLKETGIQFPSQDVKIINDHGCIPYIRMMPRSEWVEPDPIYSMQKFIDGEFDSSLSDWAIEAKQTNIPLIVEFGTEVNGDWFSWNGRWNGGAESEQYGDPEYPDGPERFRDAYRHIIDLFRAQDVHNITWVFHIDAKPNPVEPWNNMKAYYPGDDYIDWIGISVYGPQLPSEKWRSFTEILDIAYPEIVALSTNKPHFIAEFGVIDYPELGDKATWIQNALQAIKIGRYPRVKAISYWHETFSNDDGSVTNLRLDSSPQALSAYREGISDSVFISKAYFSN